jgi:hypothetical protein
VSGEKQDGQTGVRPPWLDAPLVDPYPYPESYDLRTDPPLNRALGPLLPYVGVWRGRGSGGYPTIEDFEFAQEVRITHDGRPFLAYESRAWVIEPDGTPVRPAYRESGFWRPVLSDERFTGELEILLTSPTGVTEMYLGRLEGTRVEMATDAVLRTATAKPVSAGRRLYGIVEGALLYAQEMAAMDHPMAPHLSARLQRVGG